MRDHKDPVSKELLKYLKGLPVPELDDDDEDDNLLEEEHLEDELFEEDDGINRFGAIESTTDFETLNRNNEAGELSAAQLYAVRENDPLDWNGYETDGVSLNYDSDGSGEMEINE